jgi:TonB-linked SusC/RagA family outer membrane protein
MRRFTLFLALMIFIGMQVAQAQTRTLSGTVTNAEDGSTIPGVSVVVKGTTIGTTTDLQGRYSLLVTADSRILQFSFVGMKAIEVPIGAEDVINVTMEPEVTAIEGVVVTAIGVKRETKALGYSVQAVGGDDIARSGNTNVINSLASRAAGVSVTSSSGAAGSSSFMTIRGVSSMTGNNQPLFVIDGIPIDNSELASTTRTAGVAYSNRAIDINPEDIETMSILKGGAATALYGIRAANGAVVITTKKGAATPGKRMDVSFNSSVRFEKVSQLPTLQDKYAQGSGGNLNLGGTTASYGPLISDLRLDINNKTPYYPDGTPIVSDDPNLPQMKAYDNYDSFFQTGVTYDNSLSISGGSTDATYYFSIADLRSESIIPNNTFNRTSIALAGDAKISNKVKTSGRMSYINSGGTRIQQGSNTSGVMLALTRMPVSFDVSGGVDDPADNEASYMLPSGAQRNAYNGGGYDNPFWTVNKNPFEDKVNRFIGSIQFDYAATDWLDFTYRFGTDLYTDRRKQIIAIGSRTSPTGQVYEDHYFRQDLNSDLFATARFNLTDDLKGTFLLGNNLFQSDYQNLYNSIGGLVVPDFYNLSNAASVYGFEYNSRKRTMAFYADLGLDYKSMLYLNVTMRREQSTTLPEANNTFNYPSVSGSFVFTELPGLQDNSVLSFGKVRASYAQIGNDAPVFFTIPTYSSATAGDGWTTVGIQFPNYGTAGYMVANTLANPDLKPETAKNFEVGFDLRFLQNRIGFDFTYFDMKNEDLILSVPIAKSSGYYNANLNAASMTNSGIEIVLKTTPVMNNDFKWDLDFNFTKIENEVTKLADGVESVFLGGFVGKQVRAVVGNPYGSIFGTDFQRNDAGQLIINDDPNSPEYGYPMMDPEDQNIGNVLPDWTLGIFNSLSYKDFRLDFLLDIKTGGKMWNGTRGALMNFGMTKETEARGTEIVFDGVKESDGSVNDISAVLDQAWYTGNGGGFFGPGAPYVDDTDWVRLRELTFSYMLPRQTMNEWGLESAELYFTGRNLWLSTPYDGVDPETSLYGSDNAQGLDYFNMPGVKSYMIGLRVNL